MEAIHNCYICNITKALGLLQKGGQQDYKSQWDRGMYAVCEKLHL